MQVKKFEDHNASSAAAASEIITLLQNKADAVICMASGETPRLTCKLLVEKARKEQTDLRRFTFIGLDEWVGIASDNPGSCRSFFQSELITPLNLFPNQVHLFNAEAEDLEAECKKMDELIESKSGIDLMIVGIGMNGHIGFNEPGVAFTNTSHVANLDELTISVGQKYFTKPEKLKKGITLGLKNLKEARKVILMANGKKKAEVIKKAVESEVSNSFPATIIQTHPQGYVMVDKEAGSLLAK